MNGLAGLKNFVNSFLAPSIPLCLVLLDRGMDSPGIEPGADRCKRTVLPLDYEPSFYDKEKWFLSLYIVYLEYISYFVKLV